MAINIPDNVVSDHVIFDRIVDADRTITMARNAAEKAEAAGKHDTAERLRQKADALEKILLATQNPDYEEEEEIPPVSGGNEGNGANDQGDSSDSGETQGTGETDSEEGQNDQSEDGDSGSAGGAGGQEEDEAGKTPDDIKKMNGEGTGMKDHSGSTQQIGPGGSGSGTGGGGSGSSNSNNKKKSKSTELDPFKKSGQGNGQKSQPTPEEIKAAVIKRLSELKGNARTGAERALKQLFGETGGIGDIDD